MESDNLEERSIQVLDIPDDLDDDYLLLYFENRRRSGGGTLVSLDRDGDKALLVFENSEDAARVLTKESHTLNGLRMIVRKKPPTDRSKILLGGLSPTTSLEMVELFVENLTGADSSKYTLYPTPSKELVLVHLHEPTSEGFQRMHEKVSRRKLDGVQITLQEVECTDSILVENLPSSVREDMLTLYFESSLSGGGEVIGITMMANGLAQVSFKNVESVDSVLQKSHKLEETDLVVKPYFPFLEEKRNESGQSLDYGTCLSLSQSPIAGGSPLNQNTAAKNKAGPELGNSPQASSISSDQAPATPAPYTQPSPTTLPVSMRASYPIAASVAVEAMEVDYFDQKASVSNISVPDPAKLKLLGLSNLLDNLRNTHPNFDIRLTQDGVQIKGPGHLESERLKNKLLEFLSGFSQIHLSFSPLKAQFLQKETIKDRLKTMLKDEDLTSMYTVTDSILIITAPSLSTAKQAGEKIKCMVVEFGIPVLTEYEGVLYSQEWSTFLMSLDMCTAQETGRGKTITVVTLKGMEEEMKANIIRFLSTPIQRETVLSMEPGMLTYIQLHQQQLLSDMDQVVIFPLDTGDGLSIQGNSTECQVAAEVLSAVIASTYSKTITVSQPGIARFLKEEEGTSILGEMTAKFQVYICMDKVHWESLEDEDIFELAWKLSYCQNFQRSSSEQMNMDPNASELSTVFIEEAKRILSVVSSDHSSEPASLRATISDEEDLYTDTLSSYEQVQDEGSPRAADDVPGSTNICNLEEDARLSLAIQMSMESSHNSGMFAEADLQKVLELSKQDIMLVDESDQLEKAVDVSLQEAIKSANRVEIVVYASYTHDLIRVDIALGKKVGLRQCEEKLEHKSLRKLSAFDRRCIDLVKRKHAVEIQIQGTTAIVSGFKNYVSEALPDLREILKRAGSSATDAEILKKVEWVWCEQGSSEGRPYSPEATVFIESAWRLKKKKIDILFNNQPYTIDFEKMQEFSVSSGRSVLITRKIKSSEEKQANLSISTDEDYSLLADVPDTSIVDEGSDEFDEVVRHFYDSIHQYHNKIKIVKVEKIMNKLLYNQYKLKKVSMEQSSTNLEVERTLYHGTSEVSVREITIHGFNRSFCGKNATVYGQGVYFAVESALSVSDTYSPPNADGHKFIFVAKVLTGDFTVGQHEMKTAPLKDNSQIPVRYHSVVDKEDSPTLFVIFNDTQAYPQYLITCKKIYG